MDVNTGIGQCTILGPLLFARNTRGADRDTSYVERYRNNRYKNSPYYVGAELWNTLYNCIKSIWRTRKVDVVYNECKDCMYVICVRIE